MRWVLRLMMTGDDARCLSTDLVEICRPDGLGDIAKLGLTLREAKQLLASVQTSGCFRASRQSRANAAALPIL